MDADFKNPFRPGAGHPPPYLAGREGETSEFQRLLGQTTILENMVLTGLRGVGKTVLLDTFKPLAIKKNWLWVGTDLSETTSLTEENMAIRLMTDLSVVTSSLIYEVVEQSHIGFAREAKAAPRTLDFERLVEVYKSTPGLVSDKIKHVLELVWRCLLKDGRTQGLVFAYDEAQNLADHSDKERYPLSLLLDVFQSIQKRNIPFLLVLTGLPSLFAKLVDARTFAERMFHVVFLDRLNEQDSRDAILRPIEEEQCPVKFDEQSVKTVIGVSGGYPYFIQFICREVYDVFIQQISSGQNATVPVDGIVRKLDSDFFAGRWARPTDRQRDLLSVIAQLDSSDSEFTVQEVVALSKKVLDKGFNGSHVVQMLASLINIGLIYKNRYGKYTFAVPLMGQFILRQIEQSSGQAE